MAKNIMGMEGTEGVEVMDSLADILSEYLKPKVTKRSLGTMHMILSKVISAGAIRKSWISTGASSHAQWVQMGSILKARRV